MGEIIDGRKISKKIQENIICQVQKLILKGYVPGLVIIIIGEDFSSNVYVRNEERLAADVGISEQTIRFSSDVKENVVLDKINKLNKNNEVDAILLQSPIPKHINEQKIRLLIDSNKDVDGFNPINIGKLFINSKDYYPIASTPKGIMTLLSEYHVDLQGKFVVVLGRSILVGYPLFYLLEAQNATVTLLHSYTNEKLRKSLLKQADVVITATGVPNLIYGKDLKVGSVVIDVGIIQLSNGNVVGDINFDTVKDIASLTTPVPGGVGPMTTITLLKTTVELAVQHHKRLTYGRKMEL